MELKYMMSCLDEENDIIVALVSSYSEEGMLEESGKSKWTKTIKDYIEAVEKKEAVGLMKNENDSEHDCHFVGGGGESGCDNPVHKDQPEP